MNRYERAHLGDASLLAQMGINASRNRKSNAEAIADGRLHLSGVVVLAPHLKQESREAAEALLMAASYKSRSEIEKLLQQHLRGAEPTTSPASSTPSAPGESPFSAAMPETHQLSSAETPFQLSAPGRI